MKKFFITTWLIGGALDALVLSAPAIATDNNKEIPSSEMKMDHSAHKGSSNSSIKVEILPLGEIKKGQSSEVKIKLTSLKNDKAIQLSDLKEVHTEKIHILIFDNTLTDYQHIHPTPTQEAGIYQFVWTPKNEGDYRLWVDVVPVQTNNEEYIMAFLDKVGQSKETMVKTLQSTCKVDENEYSLTFDKPRLTQGKAVMGKIKIIDAQGQDVKKLEPLMGAFGHIVAINEDFETIAHVHPMGREPLSSSERGGPELAFHFVPEKAGFYKIWLQIQISGKDIYVPFGVEVNS